ncbi:MAG TPA: MMPL family transporter [Acidimicrobiales bacterium]|nr:MMPL family transporter [Acidimicrobiales bacterium]
MLETLARWCYHHRKRVLLSWIAGFIAIVTLGATGGGPFSTDFRIPGSESKKALQILEERFPARAGDTISVIYEADAGINSPGVRARVEKLVAGFDKVEHVVGTVTPYSPEGAGSISPDGKIAFASLQLDIQGTDMPIELTKDMIAEAEEASEAGLRFELSGQAVQQAEFVNGGGEGPGFLAAMVILLISFGSLLAMGLPILSAFVGIGIGLAILQLLAHLVEVPDFSPIVAAMVGIGVGIDYALFIVTRYRQSLHMGKDPEEATVLAITTAGRAVLFAGTTVVISVLGLLLMGLPFMQGVALGSAGCVLVTMLASITLLPAMLGFTGTNIDRFKVPFISRDEGDHRSGFWFRWSRLIQRRPWPAFLGGLVLLLVLAAPMFSLRLGFPGDETQPTERTTRRSYDLFAKGFGPGFNAPLVLAAELPSGKPDNAGALGRIEQRLAGEEGVAKVVPAQVNPSGDTAVFTVFPTTGGQSEETEELVGRLRDSVIPEAIAGTGIEVQVGGPNAGFIDSNTVIADRLPLFIAVVVGLSFILLMAVFRSVLVALKAALMNLLSIGAAYGVLVAVAQWGWGRSIFGISATGPVASFIPMMMFAILFGLSMDYEVFLLSRVREEYVRTGDNGLAVADGLAATARVITAAAAIMIMVFLSFVLGPELVIKQVGLGLAAAIFIDATLVRMVLVPATMELLGRANWWLPPWLDRLLPHVGFEGASEEAPHEVPPAPPAPQPAGTAAR